jgi:glycosyltransferase involved in cell wall biosynthesis
LVKGLTERGYPLDVLVASAVPADLQKARDTFRDSKNMHLFAFASPRGWRSKLQTFLRPHSYAFDAGFLTRLKELNPDSYDLIHVEQTWGGWPVWSWPRKTLINVHFLQAIDLENVRPDGLKQRLLFQSWFRAEKKILTHFPFIRTCSPRLQQAIAKWGRKELLKSVPFGIDSSLYRFIPQEERQTRQPIVTLIGNMAWSPSLSAARRLIDELWPEIQKQVPEARLRIVGWSARARLKDSLNNPSIEILENVPDTQKYFAEASLLIYAPSRGSGMKIKIQEALLYGVPVVTTSEGAEGLPAEDMVHMGLSDDNAGLIERAVRILQDPKLQEALREKGRALIEDVCGPDTTVEQIENLYREILAKPR